MSDSIVTPQELADELIGTCSMCVPEERLATQDDVAAFDMLAFECEGCGWWCDPEELNNETDRQLCDECAEDEE